MKIIIIMLAALYGGQAAACELSAHHKNHHKRPCAEAGGKPCPLDAKAQKSDDVKHANDESKASAKSGFGNVPITNKP